MKFDLFYQLPQADTQRTPARYTELIEEAVAADQLGFDTIWLAEVHFARHFSMMPAPMLLHAAIAQRTARIRLGVAVNLMPLHHPLRLAEETAKQVAEGILRVDLQSLLQRVFGFLQAAAAVEQQSLATPSFRIGRVRVGYLVHDLESGLVLAVFIQAERLIHGDMDGLAAPLEFLAAAARTRRVEI